MLLLAAAALAVAPQPMSTQLQGTSPNCPRTTSYYAWQRGKSVKPQRLTELPDANLYLTVYRRIGGCEVPVVVKYGVSGR
jgi:hypothetical protein